MSAIYYTIQIKIDEDEVLPEDKEEIAESAEGHDADGGLRRFLGDKVNDVEDQLQSSLPEGFTVKIIEALA